MYGAVSHLVQATGGQKCVNGEVMRNPCEAKENNEKSFQRGTAAERDGNRFRQLILFRMYSGFSSTSRL